MRQPFCHNTYSSFDFYPFGMIMPGRAYSGGSGYRFGFNKGSEKDNEIYDEGNAYTTEFRELDVRVPVWWGCDPKPKPYESPYVSMGNNPILFDDPYGDVIIAGKEAQKNIGRADKSIFGKEKNPFEFKNGTLTVNEDKYNEIIKNGTKGQQEIAQKLHALIKDVHIINVQVVDFEKTKIKSFDENGNAVNKTLMERFFGAATVTNLNADPSKGEATFNVYIGNNEYEMKAVPAGSDQGAKNPQGQNTETQYTIPVQAFVSKATNSIKTLHEFGHCYYRLFYPELQTNDHNKNVENFEHTVRTNYMQGGHPYGGTVKEHPRKGSNDFIPNR